MTGIDSSISNVSSDVCLLVIRDASGAMISDHRLSVSKWLPNMLNSFDQFPYGIFNIA